MEAQQLQNNEIKDFDDKLDTLRTTLRTMLHEVAAESQPVSIDPDRGVNYYDKVTRFEVQLIESALELAGGRQNRAAKLLHLPTSTLCTKMKQFNIGRNGRFSRAA